MTTLVGGVGQLYQGDLDLGRLVAERLQEEDLGPDALVEDLYYGAIAVVQRLEDLEPDTLILVGAHERDRAPGTVERRRVDELDLSTEQVQVAVGDAGTGYVDLQLVIEVAWGLGALPDRTVVIEVEPADVGPSEELSPAAWAGLERALDLVRAEVRRAPLLDVAGRIRRELSDGHLEPSPTREAMADLLGQLELLDREGRWGRTFAERDRLRLRISSGETSESMTHADWGLWWGLIEELDRLQGVEAHHDPSSGS